MTTTPRIFAQIKPQDLVNSTRLYTVTAAHQAQLTVFVCNQTNALEFFRIAVVPAPAAGITISQPDISNYIAYDTQLIGNGVFAVSGIGLNSGDMIYVKSQFGGISFTATGIEFS